MGFLAVYMSLPAQGFSLLRITGQQFGSTGTPGTPPSAVEKSKSLGFNTVSLLLKVTWDIPGIVCVPVEHWRT